MIWPRSRPRGKRTGSHIPRNIRILQFWYTNKAIDQSDCSIFKIAILYMLFLYHRIQHAHTSLTDHPYV